MNIPSLRRMFYKRKVDRELELYLPYMGAFRPYPEEYRRIEIRGCSTL